MARRLVAKLIRDGLLLHFLLLSGILGLAMLREVMHVVGAHLGDVQSLVQIIRCLKTGDMLDDIWADRF